MKKTHVFINEHYVFINKAKSTKQKIEDLVNRAINKVQEIDEIAFSKLRELFDIILSFVAEVMSSSRSSNSVEEKTSLMKNSLYDFYLESNDAETEIAGMFMESIVTLFYQPRFNAFIRNMSLVYLIAEFESFLQDVLEITFRKKPEILATTKKSVTYEELVKFEDIEEAKQQIIDKEIIANLELSLIIREKFYLWYQRSLIKPLKEV